jgi:hypothetical protein
MHLTTKTVSPRIRQFGFGLRPALEEIDPAWSAKALTETARRSPPNWVSLIPFLASIVLQCQWGFNPGGTSKPDFFLKPVASSAGRLPRHYIGASSKLGHRNGYILADRERPSPFHAEPAQVRTIAKSDEPIRRHRQRHKYYARPTYGPTSLLATGHLCCAGHFAQACCL